MGVNDTFSTNVYLGTSVVLLGGFCSPQNTLNTTNKKIALLDETAENKACKFNHKIGSCDCTHILIHDSLRFQEARDMSEMKKN